LSESLRECETEKITKDHYVATGKWRCSRDGEEITWESRVERRLADAAGDAKDYVETEQREMRKEVAREIEKHIREEH
jgi:hypothetical protein